mgnify:FL=1
MRRVYRNRLHKEQRLTISLRNLSLNVYCLLHSVAPEVGRLTSFLAVVRLFLGGGCSWLSSSSLSVFPSTGSDSVFLFFADSGSESDEGGEAVSSVCVKKTCQMKFIIDKIRIYKTHKG